MPKERPDYGEWMENLHSRLEPGLSTHSGYTMSDDGLYRRGHSPELAAAMLKHHWSNSFDNPDSPRRQGYEQAKFDKFSRGR